MAEKKKEKKKAVSKEKKAMKKEKPKKEEVVTGGKIFTIPLRKAFDKSRNKRAPYAARLIRKYLKTHMKIDDVKLGKMLNEKIWERGIERPPRRVRVRAVIDNGVVKAELMGHAYRDFKATPKKESRGMKERLMDRLGAKAFKKQEEEDKLSSAKSPEKPEKVEKHNVEEG